MESARDGRETGGSVTYIVRAFKSEGFDDGVCYFLDTHFFMFADCTYIEVRIGDQET